MKETCRAQNVEDIAQRLEFAARRSKTMEIGGEVKWEDQDGSGATDGGDQDAL